MAGNRLLIVSSNRSDGSNLKKALADLKGLIAVIPFAELSRKLLVEAPDCVLLFADTPKQKLTASVEITKAFDDNLPIIVIHPSSKVEEAIELMKRGIHDYFTALPPPSQLMLSLHNAFRLYDLTKRVFLLENQLGGEIKLDELIGAAPVMQTVFQTIKNVAQSNTTVLVTGESGTGKELVAKAIHRLSKRAGRRFVDINCGAIPRELLENELFGHERGAYTGADRRYIGCCERADGGSLFLDEVSEMDFSLQVKLLRFLQERKFMRVGGTEPITVDLAVIAATNKNLLSRVAEGTFREDLFYRLHVVTIEVPPLRERREDIPLLAKHFLERYSHKSEKLFLGFAEDCMEALVQYDWPGNVRELENVIERTVALHNDTKVKIEHLPEAVQEISHPGGSVFPKGTANSGSADKILPLDMVERYAIEQALRLCTGNVSTAAKRLKIGAATLYRKIKHYGIRP